MIAHIINNMEISLTECDLLLLPEDPETDRSSENYGKPVVLRNGEIAIWDDVETPRGATTCSKCYVAYVG